MTLLTKQEIEALLDGTTPGPWASTSPDHPEQGVFGCGYRIAKMTGGEFQRDRANAAFMKAAPDLARTALDALARLEDAEAAQALVVERAAEAARRHHSKVQINEPLWHDGQDWASDRIAEAIEALADPSGVEALAALRAERDVLRADRDSAARMWQAAEQEKEAAVARSREASQMLAIETNHATQAEAEAAVLRARLAAAEGRVAALTEALEACVASLERANTAEGVCCCGDSMDRHPNPMNCGHSPVDIGDYYAGRALEAARAALAAVTPPADTPEGRT